MEELIHCYKGKLLNTKQALTACRWVPLLCNQGELKTPLGIAEGTEAFEWPIIPSENDRLLHLPGCRISCEQLFFEYWFFRFHRVGYSILLNCGMNVECSCNACMGKAAERLGIQLPRALEAAFKMPTISRAKRSAAMPGWAADWGIFRFAVTRDCWWHR